MKRLYVFNLKLTKHLGLKRPVTKATCKLDYNNPVFVCNLQLPAAFYGRMANHSTAPLLFPTAKCPNYPFVCAFYPVKNSCLLLLRIPYGNAYLQGIFHAISENW